MTNSRSDTATLTRETTKTTVAPSRWKVIFHNDDVTTMEFVVLVLVKYFGKNFEDANELMMKVHTEGRAVAGVYSKDVAETKIEVTTTFARSEGYPLSLTMEEV